MHDKQFVKCEKSNTNVMKNKTFDYEIFTFHIRIRTTILAAHSKVFYTVRNGICSNETIGKLDVKCPLFDMLALSFTEI